MTYPYPARELNDARQAYVEFLHGAIEQKRAILKRMPEDIRRIEEELRELEAGIL